MDFEYRVLLFFPLLLASVLIILFGYGFTSNSNIELFIILWQLCFLNGCRLSFFSCPSCIFLWVGSKVAKKKMFFST